MNFEVLGKCKSCGADTHFVLSLSAPEEYDYAIRCFSCGKKAERHDREFFYHLTDTMLTAHERNSITNITKIILHGR